MTRRSILVLALASSLTATSLAFAAIPAEDGSITACYNASTDGGGLRIVHAAADCRPSEDRHLVVAEGAGRAAG